jgi:GAF domain-containing protein
MATAGCLRIFEAIGEAFNSGVDTHTMLERIARSICEHLGVAGCHFRLLSRDQRQLEHVVAVGLSDRFVHKGPVLAERSVAEALEGQIVEVADCTSDPRIQYPDAFREEGLASMLTVPLASRGQVVGVMRLFSSEPRRFTADELEIIEVVASLCSAAILHSMFQQILRHVTQSIRTSLDLREVFRTIVGVVSEDLRARGCLLGLLDPRGSLDVVASTGFSDTSLAELLRDPGDVIREALRGETVAITDAVGDPRVPFAEAAGRMASVLAVPLVVRDRSIGVLVVTTHHPYRFSDEELHLMGSVAEQCALAIRNAQMYDAMRRRYDEVVDDFQQWFEHTHVFPGTDRTAEDRAGS